MILLLAMTPNALQVPLTEVAANETTRPHLIQMGFLLFKRYYFFSKAKPLNL